MSYHERPAKLAGYRDLSEDEVDLVDRIKAAEAVIGGLWREVQGRPDTDKRMAAVAKTNLQDSFMWLVRSVTRPRDVFSEEL